MDPDSRQCESQPHETIRVSNTANGNLEAISPIATHNPPRLAKDIG